MNRNNTTKKSITQGVKSFTQAGVNPAIAAARYNSKMRAAMGLNAKVTVNTTAVLNTWLDTIINKSVALSHKLRLFTVVTRCKGLYCLTSLRLGVNRASMPNSSIKNGYTVFKAFMLPLPISQNGVVTTHLLGNHFCNDRVHLRGYYVKTPPKYEDVLNVNVDSDLVHTEVVVLSSTIREGVETCTVLAPQAQKIDTTALHLLLNGNYESISQFSSTLEEFESVIDVRVFDVDRPFNEVEDTQQVVGSLMSVWVPPLAKVGESDSQYPNGVSSYSPDEPLELSDVQMQLMGIKPQNNSTIPIDEKSELLPHA